MNDNFFPELTRRLRQEGIATGETEAKDYLPVLAGAEPPCGIGRDGTILLSPGTMNDPAVNRTYDAVAGIAAEVRGYTAAMAAAPPLKAAGLDEDYRLLAEFNGVVLAGHELNQGWGYQFVTWRRDFDRTGVANGNYYMNDFTRAKLDFACRAGLVDGHRQFTDEQLSEVYRCIHETLDSAYPLTEERRDVLISAAEQIEHGVDNLKKLVQQSNQRELEAAQTQTAGPALGL